MTADELIQLIHKEASEDTVKNYQSVLQGGDQGLNPAWDLFKQVYSGVAPDKQELLWDFVRMVQSDSISSILSILDNQTYPSIQKEDLKLMHGSEPLNGNLTDIYWEKEEEGW